jgi:hypothetical protein
MLVSGLYAEGRGYECPSATLTFGDGGVFQSKEVMKRGNGSGLRNDRG